MHVGIRQGSGRRAVLVGAGQCVVGEARKRAAAKIKHLLLEVEKVLCISTTHTVRAHPHLLQAIRSRRLGGRVIVHPAVDPRPRALLLHHVLTTAVCGDLTEESIEIHLTLPQHGLFERADVPVLDEEFEAVHELGLLARVLWRVTREAERVVGRVVFGNGTVVVLRVPYVHRALEVGQHGLIQRAMA